MTSGTENLYLVHLSDYETLVPDLGECFLRAVVYADSPEEAVNTVCDWIDFCNEEQEDDEEDDDDIFGLGEIYYERDDLVATLLAENAQRPPDDSTFTSENILFFETDFV